MILGTFLQRHKIVISSNISKDCHHSVENDNTTIAPYLSLSSVPLLSNSKAHSVDLSIPHSGLDGERDTKTQIIIPTFFQRIPREHSIPTTDSIPSNGTPTGATDKILTTTMAQIIDDFRMEQGFPDYNPTIVGNNEVDKDKLSISV